MDKQKLLIGVLIAVAVVLLFVSFFTGNNDSSQSKTELTNDVDTIMENAQKESSSVKDSEKKDLPEITVDEYLNYYEGDENKLVLIARPTCGYCQIAEPILQNLAYEYELDMKYLNTDNFSGDDETNFVESDEFFNEGFGTPILVIVGDNKILDKVDGLVDKAHYIEFLKKYEFIK